MALSLTQLHPAMVRCSGHAQGLQANILISTTTTTTGSPGAIGV